MRIMRHRKWARRRQMVEKYSGCYKGRILDVGSSTGLFLNEMKLSGWKTNGIEPNEQATGYARERFGLDIFHGTLEQTAFDDQSFDVITYWDVLEHTYSPSSELHTSARLLKPGGLIAINIPNWDSFDRFLFGPFWIGYDPPRHLYHFPPIVLSRMLNQNGFKVIDWVCFIPSYFSFVLSVERWLEICHPKYLLPVKAFLNFPGMRLIFEPWFYFSSLIKRAGIITVFARKTDI